VNLSLLSTDQSILNNNLIFLNLFILLLLLRIKAWWLAHHFITTVCTAILLIWPESQSYNYFRDHFILFSFYISFVQLLQYYYQKGSLYRLRALGEKEDMDVSVGKLILFQLQLELILV
jgi:hypothetical protein